MMVYILDNSYSKRVKGQPWVMFNHYNGDVYGSRERAMKTLAEMANSVSADSECFDGEFDGNLRIRWIIGSGDELERYIQIESREVK